jgi:hypothetical protein
MYNFWYTQGKTTAVSRYFGSKSDKNSSFRIIDDSAQTGDKERIQRDVHIFQLAADSGSGREEPDPDEQHLAQPGLGGLLARLECFRIRRGQGWNGHPISLTIYCFKFICLFTSP